MNVSDSEQILENLYNAFDPFAPLPPDDPQYVDFQQVRGDNNILMDVGNKIRRSRRMTCQLYTGHRGGGKSTELLRLREHLQNKKICVVYFATDEQDVDAEDTQYTDLLLACARHLLEDLKDSAKPTPILNWMRDRWKDLKDLALTEVEFDKLTVEAQIAQLGKITANLRAVPQLRQQIRDKINPQTVTLIQVVNEFIDDAKKNLPNGYRELAVIADNLDRIVPIVQESDRTNHEEIFLDRSEQLKSLNCHLLYTVPISLVYSRNAIDLRETYDGNLEVLPMVMVEQPNGKIYEPGLQKIQEVIQKRVNQHAPNLQLAGELFDSEETLQQLCRMSGGHVRNLLLLIQDAINRTETLPIKKRALQRAITEARTTYRRSVEDDQWELLAEVSQTKQLRNQDDYRDLLFNRCILEYRYLDENGEIQEWHHVHPLLRGTDQLQAAIEQRQS